MDSGSDNTSVVSGTTMHSGNSSPDLSFNILKGLDGRSFQNAICASDNASSPVIPITRSRFQNVIEEPVYCSPLKKQKQSEDDMDSDIESHFSQSVLTNYKQKAYTLTQTHEIHADVCEKQPKDTTNEVDSQDSDATRLSSQETTQTEDRGEQTKKKQKEKGILKQTGERLMETQDVNNSQIGGSQVLFPDSQSSIQSFDKQIMMSSQTSSGMSTASSNLKDLESTLSKEEMVTAFGKIRKIHAQIDKNIKNRDISKNQKECFEKKLAVVHQSLKNISERMSNEKVRISFDVKHSVKTAAARDRLREQMKDLTQRQAALKDLLMKQAELTRCLKQGTGNTAQSQVQRNQPSEKSNAFENKVNEWMNKNPVSVMPASQNNSLFAPALKIPSQVSLEKMNEFSKGQKQAQTTPVVAGVQRTGNTQTLHSGTGLLAIPMNISKQAENIPTHAIHQPKTTASDTRSNQTIIYVYSQNSNTVNTEKVLAQVQTQSRNPAPVLSPPATKKNPQTKAPTTQSSQNFKRPSEIMKSPPLFNPNSFLQKTLKSPPVQSTVKPSFKSPPISLPRSAAEEKNISPSTVCSSDVFPVSCKELGRRIQERIASQREAESQQLLLGQRSYTCTDTSQGQRSYTCTDTSQGQVSYLSQRGGDQISFSQGNESNGWKKQGTPVKIISLTEQCSTKAAAENMDIGCEQLQYEKYGGLKFPPLKSLVDLHVLYPAENVLAALYMGKVFTASLTMMGNIEGKGGEVFNTPMKWLSAVKGGEVVKKAQAYREIKYDGHSLKSYVDGEQQTSIEKINVLKQRSVQEKQETKDHPEHRNETSKPMDDEDKEMADLLFQCKVQLLDKTDLVPMDDLPENFWSSDFRDVHLSYSFWNQLNDWKTLAEPLTL
ncbi:serine-rich adhesin for platelets isoform X2 [Magallana gigas]|uniref:serine-rich adhesin for platelets isoform X2 n=1 Tax=Magallana gigas TaxID=29159 RepID=UPI00333F0E50